MILIIMAVISIVIGYLRKGRLAGIMHMRLRGIWILILAFAMEASTGLLVRYLPDYFPEYIWLECLIQYGLLFTFVLLNDHRWEVMVMGLGILSNFLVMILNGGRMPIIQSVVGMPQYAELVNRIQSGAIPEYFIMQGGERLWFLGDVIHIPVLNMGFGSVGDFILALGLCALILTAMVSARPKHAKGGANRNEQTRPLVQNGDGSGFGAQ